MGKLRFILIVISALFCFHSSAQDPSYFVIGASEFKNADIYSILHTTNQKLYIATNEGLYEYKHGKMYQIKQAKEQRDASLFNLIENSQNEVFCFNLNGQIFKIEDNALKLFFQIPDKYYKVNIQMWFDDIGRLIVSAGGCFALSDNGLEEIYYSENHKILRLNKFLNGEIILSIADSGTMIKIKNGSATIANLETNSEVKTIAYDKLELNNCIITSNKLINLSPDLKSKLRDKEFYKYSQITENEIWGRSNVSGIRVFISKNDNTDFNKNYFSNTFISSIAIDELGTIFLGTFGKGLFVIPSRKTEKYNNIITGNNLIHIAADEDNIYITDIIKGIIIYNYTNNKVDQISGNRPTKVFAFEQNKSNLYHQYPKLFHGANIGRGDVKNILEIDSSTYLMASSAGLLKVGKSNVVSPRHWEGHRFIEDISISPLFKKRCTDVAYDSKEKILYVSTMSFLKGLTKNKEIIELNFNGYPIIANDLLFEDGLLWCATQNFGILVFKNNQIVKQIDTNSGLGNNYVFKFEKKSGRLFISHKTGFQIYSISTQEWMTIGTADGVENGTVKDFCLQGDKIWFISNNQIISYALENFNSQKPKMTIAYDSIKVNDHLISTAQAGNLEYNENNIAIYPFFSGLLYESEVELHYTLENEKTKEVIQKNPISISNNLIEFKYLPHGEYKFNITAKYRDIKINSETYRFTINKAFWKTNWFLTAIILLTTLVLLIFYKIRTRKIRQANLEELEIQELKTEAIKAELKALRSQMNPHFIFNSLNSIQDLILKEDTEASYDYLVLFSELVRNALAYSNQNLISIEKEILFLQTYLKLEKLRFGSDFEFNISNKAPNGLVIPSLVIQPFVENAIAHGVFHIKGKKIIEIELFVQNDNLVCTVQDNGKGREYSKKLQYNSTKNHKSYALDAINKRLQFLQVEYGNNIGFEINDIIINESFEGTKVLVRLPLIEKI